MSLEAFFSTSLNSFFALKDLALHYKSHILLYIEYRSSAIIQAFRICVEIVFRIINDNSFDVCRRDIANLRLYLVLLKKEVLINPFLVSIFVVYIAKK